VQRIERAGSWAKLRLERARADYSLVDVTVSAFKRYSDDDGGFYAAALTYFMFFAIFPLILFAASVLGYITFLNEDVKQDLLTEGLEAVPLISNILTEESLNNVIEQRGTLALVGLAMALYAGSGGIVALEHALNRVHRTPEEAGFVQSRIKSLKWLGAIALAVVLSLGMGAVSGFASSLFGTGAVAVSLFGHVLGAALGVVIFATAFLLLPNVRTSLKDVLPGALIAGIAFEVLKWAGAWFLARGAQSRAETFGAFATAAGFLVASYLLAQVTLLSAEVNAVLAERRQTRQSSIATTEEAT
jgi:membrane protein